MQLLKSQFITLCLGRAMTASLRGSVFRAVLLSVACSSAGMQDCVTQAAERPTLNHTRDPRPDILPRPFYYAHTEYRRAYNRPRYVTGWIADKISHTSQEALVWQENVQAGRYAGKHCPPVYKTYYYPKPWEVLQTGPRPDYAKPAKELPRQNDAPGAYSRSGEAILPAPTGNIELPVEE